MKITRFYKIWFYAIFATSVSLAISANAAEVLSSQDTLSNTPHIRTLAASCAACHGSNGNSVSTTPSLAGLDGAYFTAQMLAFKDGSRPATVMHHHAKGLNVDEINLLAAYFSQQKRVANVAPKPQILKASHEN
jgi:cytochrome subunit of sulfide dehydrogenase